MPDCMGVGVVTPFVGVGLVVVGTELDVVGSGGIPQFCSTQYELPFTNLQDEPTEGFCESVTG